MPRIGSISATLVLDARTFLIGMSKADSAVTKFNKRFAGIGIAAAVGLGAAVRSFSGFEKGITRAAGAASRSTSDFDGIFEGFTKAAKQASVTTEYTAKQMADGLNFLAMAGNSASESIKALPAVAQLASSSMISLGQAADITTNIMAGFGKSSGDLESVNDQLVGTFTSSNVSLTQLGESMKQIGSVAQATGVEFDDVLTAVGQLGNAGRQGEEAGTGLARVLLNLAGPSKQQAEAFKKLGVSINDVSEGGISQLVRNLEAAQDKLGKIQFVDALSKGFGKIGIKSVAALVSQGADAFDELRVKIGEADEQNKAAFLEAKQLETLQGQVNLLKSEFAALAIDIGATLKPALSILITVLKDAISLFASLPGPVKAFIISITAATAVVGTFTAALIALRQAGLIGTGQNLFNLAAAYKELSVAAGSGNLIDIFGNKFPGAINAFSASTLKGALASSRLASVIGLVGAAYAGAKIGSAIYESYDNAAKAADALAKSNEAVAYRLRFSGTAIRETEELTGKLSKKQIEAVRSSKEMRDGLSDIRGQSDQLNYALDSGQISLDEYGSSMKSLKQEAKLLIEPLGDVYKKLTDIEKKQTIGIGIDLRNNAIQNAAKTFLDAKEKAKKYKEELEAINPAAIKNGETLRKMLAEASARFRKATADAEKYEKAFSALQERGFDSFVSPNSGQMLELDEPIAPETKELTDAKKALVALQNRFARLKKEYERIFEKPWVKEVDVLGDPLKLEGQVSAIESILEDFKDDSVKGFEDLEKSISDAAKELKELGRAVDSSVMMSGPAREAEASSAGLGPADARTNAMAGLEADLKVLKEQLDVINQMEVAYAAATEKERKAEKDREKTRKEVDSFKAKQRKEAEEQRNQYIQDTTDYLNSTFEDLGDTIFDVISIWKKGSQEIQESINRDWGILGQQAFGTVAEVGSTILGEQLAAELGPSLAGIGGPIASGLTSMAFTVGGIIAKEIAKGRANESISDRNSGLLGGQSLGLFGQSQRISDARASSVDSDNVHIGGGLGTGLSTNREPIYDFFRVVTRSDEDVGIGDEGRIESAISQYFGGENISTISFGDLDDALDVFTALENLGLESTGNLEEDLALIQENLEGTFNSLADEMDDLGIPHNLIGDIERIGNSSLSASAKIGMYNDALERSQEMIDEAIATQERLNAARDSGERSGEDLAAKALNDLYADYEDVRGYQSLDGGRAVERLQENLPGLSDEMAQQIVDEMFAGGGIGGLSVESHQAINAQTQDERSNLLSLYRDDESIRDDDRSSDSRGFNQEEESRRQGVLSAMKDILETDGGYNRAALDLMTGSQIFDLLDNLGDAAGSAADSLLEMVNSGQNIPSTFKLAARVFEALNAEGGPSGASDISSFDGPGSLGTQANSEIRRQVSAAEENIATAGSAVADALRRAAASISSSITGSTSSGTSAGTGASTVNISTVNIQTDDIRRISREITSESQRNNARVKRSPFARGFLGID